MISGLCGVWEMTSTGKTVTDKHGLVRFDYKIIENSIKVHVYGELFGQEMWCTARKILTSNEKDKEELINLSTLLETQVVTYVGEVFTAIEMLSEDNTDGEIRIPLDDFDTTISQLPSILFKKKLGFKNVKIRILDTGELEILSYPITEYKQENIPIAGVDYSCRVFEVKNPKNMPTYWIEEDELGAFIVKENGKDTDVAYEKKLKDYIIENKLDR
jgi:hypothetical protein